MYRNYRTYPIIYLVLIVAITIAMIAVYNIDEKRYQDRRAAVLTLSTSYVNLIRNNLSHALSATYPLAALVHKQQGGVDGFTELAENMLPYYEGAAALQLAPDGILRHVVPLEGNEKALGHNLLEDPLRNKEAYIARETGELTLAGPFELLQGGIAAAGRLPIYLEDADGNSRFWGFSVVLMRFPDVLESARLDDLDKAGMAYELSRIHPDMGDVQVIASSEQPLIELPVEKSFQVPNGNWILKVSPVEGWRDEAALIKDVLLGLLFAILISFSTLLFYRLREHKNSLEETIHLRTKKLNDNLRTLDMALGAAGQAWFDINLQTNRAIVSEDYHKLLGFDKNASGHTISEWIDRIHPNDQQHVISQFDECLLGKEPREVQYRISAKNARWMWWHSVGEVIEWDKDNKPLRMIGIHTDINLRKRNEQVMRTLAESSSSSDNNIFKLIVRQLAISYNTRYALIGSISKNNPDTIDTLAVWGGDRYISNYSYPLEGSACGNVIRHGACSYTDNILDSFPDDSMLKQYGIRSYLGVRLYAGDGETIGHIAIFDDKPMEIKTQTIDLLNSLAVRAGIELERKRTLDRLSLFASVFSDTHEGIIITDAVGAIVDVNPAFCNTTGYRVEEVLGKNPSMLNSGKQDKSFYSEMWQKIIKEGYWKGEVWNRKKNGEFYAELLTISSLKDDDGKVIHYVGLFSDITKNKEQQKTLELIAHYDVLTQLPNRSLFVDRFTRAIARSKRSKHKLAICFLDLDEFKPVNDQYGHEVGDQLLIEVAERIKDNIREEDTVSRQGGDEFALLLGEVESFTHCEQMLVRILNSLAKSFSINGHDINISASIGVTLYPDDNADLDTLLRHADHAMYQAKLAGRNRYHLYNAEKDQRTIQKHMQLDEIREALNNDEFSLYYQPKVDMKTGKVYGVEALIRWIHPEKGMIPPIKFLPLIEGSELEILLGKWVINQAVKQLEQWHRDGLELQVSINIATHHLQSSVFLADLEAILASYPNVSPEYLELEILESSALGDISSISTTIKICRDKFGVQAALDDFGTGYSSLTHLRKFPVHTIKIDQSFVFDMLDDPNDYAIIDGVIGLANSFSREVIAEGVESELHGLMLILMGCELAQGYVIAKPMHGKDIPQWMNNYLPNVNWVTSANKQHTEKERKIGLLKLTTTHWLNCLTNGFNTEQEEPISWPCLTIEESHFGAWLQREMEQNLFSAALLKELEQTYKQMYQLAKELVLNFQKGNKEYAISRLQQMDSFVETIDSLLEPSSQS